MTVDVRRSRRVQFDLLVALVQRDVRVRFRHSFAGMAWAFMMPLATLAIYAFAFRLVLRIEPPVGEATALRNYAMFLLPALLGWTMFQDGLNAATTAISANGQLVERIRTQRALLVVSAIASIAILSAIEFMVVFLLLMSLRPGFVWVGPASIGCLALLLAFTTGLGLCIAPISARYRDFQQLTTLALRLLFFLVPIIYPWSLVPERAELLSVAVPVRATLSLNPMVHYTQALRDLLYHGVLPSLFTTSAMIGWAAASLGVGWMLFSRYEGRLAEYL